MPAAFSPLLTFKANRSNAGLGVLGGDASAAAGGIFDIDRSSQMRDLQAVLNHHGRGAKDYEMVL